MENVTLEQLLLLIEFGSTQEIKDTAGERVINLYVADGNYHALAYLTDNTFISKSIKKNAAQHIGTAATNALKKYVKKGMDENLVYLAQNEKIPESVRRNAEEAAIRMYVKKKKYDTLTKLAQNETLSKSIRRKAIEAAIKGYVQEENYYLLIKIASDQKVPESIRESAGIEVIKEYIENVTLDQLLLLIEFGSTQEIKDTAGERVINLYVADGNYRDLTRLSSDQKIPESIRKSAEEHIGPTATNAIQEYVENGNYHALANLAKNEMVPESIRRIAAEHIGAAATNAMKKNIKSGWNSPNGWGSADSNLAYLATDEVAPAGIRERAGEAAIRRYVKREKYDDLTRLAHNEKVPESVREKATQCLREYCVQLEQRL
ncbi:MAG: hypothetical protein AABX82_05550 [Nanoarchaeota archaeon]